MNISLMVGSVVDDQPKLKHHNILNDVFGQLEVITIFTMFNTIPILKNHFCGYLTCLWKFYISLTIKFPKKSF